MRASRDIELSRALPRLLSQALIALTIEIDNAVESRLPHRTTRGSTIAGSGPWLVSTAMWSNLLRWVPPEGIAQAEVADLLPLVNLAGLVRWGYARVSGDMLRLSPPGRHAAELWDDVVPAVEQRWVDRFHSGAVDRLLAALATLNLPSTLPWHLPVTSVRHGPPIPPLRQREGEADLLTLLARAVITWTADYESRSRLSLAVTANVLRTLASDGVRAAQLPALTGIAREQCAQSTALLVRTGCAHENRVGRAVVVTLTDRGLAAQRAHQRRTDEVTAAWTEQFGADTVTSLTTALHDLLSTTTDGRPTLALGLEPAPDGWRARPPYRALTTALLADPLAHLAHQPMVTHRGGYPDGS